ncbi:baseplate J/gp47 family protein [Microvirga sp. RSM25]|uniref:baseplate J/gp47 family protein n=1 Tax=Microvirga sp. RSM25 TaxID=3273802 RepID=UPI00384F057B
MLNVIDTSRLPAPNILEDVTYEAKHQEFLARFQTRWAELRAADPTLPPYDVAMLETDLPVLFSEAMAYLRTLDRIRVNDAVKAVLAPLAKGTNLDTVVARANVERKVIVPATPATAAVMETDAQLLRRYLASFDRPSAGSAARYLFEAYTAVPSLHHVAVIGRAIHGRRGDTDIVIAGEGGRLPTSAELLAVRNAVTASAVKPEATAVTVRPATLATYALHLAIAVGIGPDPILVQQEALARVSAATAARMTIGGEIPANLPVGAAYGANVVRARAVTPFPGLAADPYTLPVCGGITIDLEALA